MKKLLHALCLLLGFGTTQAQPTTEPKPQPPKKAPPAQPRQAAPSKANNFNRPVYSPEEILQRVLKLADSVRQKSDINLANVEAALGYELKKHSDSEGERYTVSSQLSVSDWQYYALFSKNILASKANPQSPKIMDFHFAFQETKPDYDKFPNAHSICALDFDSVEKALLEMGYVYRTTGRASPLPSKYYRRGDISVEVTYAPEGAVGRKPLPRRCVRMITIK